MVREAQAAAGATGCVHTEGTLRKQSVNRKWDGLYSLKARPSVTHFLQLGSTPQQCTPFPHTTGRGLRVQICEPMGDVSHSNRTQHTRREVITVTSGRIMTPWYLLRIVCLCLQTSNTLERHGSLP